MVHSPMHSPTVHLPLGALLNPCTMCGTGMNAAHFADKLGALRKQMKEQKQQMKQRRLRSSFWLSAEQEGHLLTYLLTCIAGRPRGPHTVVTAHTPCWCIFPRCTVLPC